MLDQHANRGRLRGGIAHAYLPVARRPFLIERYRSDLSGRDIAFGATLGDKTDAEAGLDHAADRLKAVDAYPHLERQVEFADRLHDQRVEEAAFLGADKVELCKFREPDLLALGESMSDRHDRDELVGPVGQDLKPGRGKIAAENADVRRVLGDGADDLLARALFEIDTDCAVNGEEVGEVAREMLKDRRHARVNSHPAAKTCRMLRKLGFHLLQVAHDDPRMPQQGLRGRGRLEPLGRAVKQRRLYKLFKV